MFAELERERTKARMTRWRAANPDRHRENDRAAKARAYADPIRKERIRTNAKLAIIARKYGLTRIEYETLCAQHGNRCAICRTDAGTLCVDHDHATGKIRGVLCQLCNIGLGGFKDDSMRLRAALKYLSRYG